MSTTRISRRKFVSGSVALAGMGLSCESTVGSVLAGKPTSGVMKDAVMLGGYQEAEVAFVADNPGMTLFHCHQQLHMDFGFMTLFDYA
jgi:ribonucleotide monophosphatase NagD (HAD superfamily)